MTNNSKSDREYIILVLYSNIGWPQDKIAWDLSLQSLQDYVDKMNTYFQNNEKMCPSGKKWRLALNYSEEALRDDTVVTVTQLNPETGYKTYGNLDDPVFVGRELPKYPRLFHERFIYLIHHKTAFMSGHMGIIHSNCVLFSGMWHIQTSGDKLYKLTELLFRLPPRQCRY